MTAYKHKTRNTWIAAFSYVDWQGNRQRKKKEGFKRKSDALEYERNFIEQSKADCTILFKNLAAAYLEDRAARLKPPTMKGKRYTFEQKILPYFENMSVSDITPNAVREWQNTLISHRQENGKPYAQTYLRTLNNQLSAVFNYAMRYYGLRVNPVRLCGSIGKQNADSMQFWTLEEFKQFMAVINDPTQRVMFDIMFYTGVRCGELLALRLDDFDTKERTVHIWRNYARHDGKDLFLEPKTPKSKRYITIPQRLCEEVFAYAERLYGYRSNQRLFDMTKHSLTNAKNRACKKSGVKQIRLHDIRHSHASLLIEMGFPPLLISERLGHEKIETTLQTYSHLYPNKHSTVADRLNDIW